MRPLHAMIAALLIACAAPAAAHANAGAATAIAPLVYWPPYNTMIPSPYDTAYDRAMVLHLRSAPVTGIFVPDPGYPQTPPVVGFAPYRFPAYGTVYQYDGLTGQYVALSQYDAARALPPPPPAPPPAPAPR